MKTKVILNGLLMNGAEHSEVLTGDLSFDAGAKCANWQHVFSGTIEFSDHRIVMVDPCALEEINAIICETLPSKRAENANARFDRLKAEVHVRRARENEPNRIDVRQYPNYWVHFAMTRPVPSEIPLFAGPRHGLPD